LEGDKPVGVNPEDAKSGSTEQDDQGQGKPEGAEFTNAEWSIECSELECTNGSCTMMKIF